LGGSARSGAQQALTSYGGIMWATTDDANAAGDDGIVRVSDPATGQLIRADLRGTRVAFSSDGGQLVTGNDLPDAFYGAATWDTVSGAEQQEFVGHTWYLSSVAFSPDPGGSYILTASRDHTARIWDRATGATLAELRGQRGVIADATFSPDGGRAATASGDGTVRIWDIASWQKSVLAGYRATYSPDGAQIATIGWNDRLIHLWDSRTGRAIRIVPGHLSAGISPPFYRPDGQQFVTGSDDGTARVWDAATGQELYRLTPPGLGDDTRVHDAAFSPDGQRIITAGQDGFARIWDATTPQHQQVLELKGHGPGSWMATARFSPNGQLVVTASTDRTARIWDLRATDPSANPTILSGHKDLVTSAAFSTDGKQIVTSSVDGTARLWDVASGKELRQLVGHSAEVTFAAFSPDGRTIATASRDHTARIWDVATGQELFWLYGHTSDVFSVAYSPDRAHVITGGWDGVVRVHPVRFEAVLAQARASIHRTLSCTERAQFLQDTRCPNP
jgi:WD40 repeat protein